jgi:hypothetical protein
VWEGREMLKLTLKNDDGVFVVSDNGSEHSLTELVPLLDQLLRASGYNYDGKLEINDEE